MGKEEGRQIGSKEEKKHLPSLNKQEVPLHALAKWSLFGSPSPSPCHMWLFGLTVLATCRKKSASKRSQPRAVLVLPTTSVFFTMFISFCHPHMGWFLSTTKHLAQGIPTLKWPPRRKECGHYSQCCDLQHVELAGLWVDLLPAEQPRRTFGSIMVSHQRKYEDLALQVQKAKRDALTQNLLSFKWTNLSSLKGTESFSKGFT